MPPPFSLTPSSSISSPRHLLPRRRRRVPKHARTVPLLYILPHPRSDVVPRIPNLSLHPHVLLDLSLILHSNLGDAIQNRIMHPNHGHQGHNPPEHQNGYANHVPNGHIHNGAPQNPSHRNPSQLSKEPVAVLGIPSVTVQNNELVVGGSDSSAFHRSRFRHSRPPSPSQQALMRVFLFPRFPSVLHAAQGRR